MRVLKQKLLIVDEQEISLTGLNAKPLSAQEQNGYLCIWFESEGREGLTPFTFYIYGTGHEIKKNDAQYLGTVVMSYGLVWHVYYKEYCHICIDVV
jgi:hypothetical protein